MNDRRISFSLEVIYVAKAGSFSLTSRSRSHVDVWGYLPGPVFYNLCYGCYLLGFWTFFSSSFLSTSWGQRETPWVAPGFEDSSLLQALVMMRLSPRASLCLWLSSDERLCWTPHARAIQSPGALMSNERAKQRFNPCWFWNDLWKHNMIATQVTPFLLAVAALLEINR